MYNSPLQFPKTYAGSCPHCGKLIEMKDSPLSQSERASAKYTMEQLSISKFSAELEVAKLNRKIEQREDFIRDIFDALKNSNSKSTLVNVLLSRCEAQINSQMLGVI